MIPSTRKSVACVVAWIAFFAAPASATHQTVFFDTHPTGGPGATGKHVFPTKTFPFTIVRANGKCKADYVVGNALGHADPRSKDPRAVCGHGFVAPLAHNPLAGTSLILVPVSSPVAPRSGKGLSAVADAGRVLRQTLPELDTVAGDALPEVVQLRQAVQTADAQRASKNIPKPRNTE